MPKFAVILPAAGKSTRFGGREKKPFTQLDGRAVWLRTAELFITRDDVVQTFLVIDPEDREMFMMKYHANIAFMNVKVIDGGAERFDSIANALAQVPGDADYIAIHDAVRPCATKDLVDLVFAAAVKHGAAIPAVRVADTVKQVNADRVITASPPRSDLWLAQTPQVFLATVIQEAYARRKQFPGAITDDSQLVEALGVKVHVVDGDPSNIKITTAEDFYVCRTYFDVLETRQIVGM